MDKCNLIIDEKNFSFDVEGDFRFLTINYSLKWFVE